MISQRARILALPSALTLVLKRGRRTGGAAAVNASPTPWSGWPEGLDFTKVASSVDLDLSQASRLVMFRLTYLPGATWNFTFPYPILVSIVSGSLERFS